MTDFPQFFAGDWQRLLETVQVPGMPDASWDRKAAWLYWCATRLPQPMPAVDNLRLLLPIPIGNTGQE